MPRLRTLMLLSLLLLAAVLLWHLAGPGPSGQRRPPPPHASSEPGRAARREVSAPPEPAPHPSQPMPPANDVALTMADGNPLRAHWYASDQPNAPVIVFDLGAGQELRPWFPPVQALLAQRAANVLWLDDAQPRHVDVAPRRSRAIARWRAALAWLEVRAPRVRLALLGAHESGDAMWQVADTSRPVSLAVIAPDNAPQELLTPEVAARFILVGLPLSSDPTPTWLGQLHNGRILRFAAPFDPQFQADLAGWLFVALGPRPTR